METLIDGIEKNRDLIACLDASDWVDLLKSIAISYLFLPSQEEVDAIQSANDISIDYNGGKLVKITLYSSGLSWEDFKIELNTSDIVISRQKGHSKFEELYRLPISTIRVLFKSKLCN